MTDEHNQQTRWLIDYLENRLSALEDRLETSIQRSEVKLSESLENTSLRLTKLESDLSQIEDEHLKLASQAGFLKNVLAFVGTAVLSLAGWILTNFINGK